MADEGFVIIAQSSDIVVARQKGRRLAAQVGFSSGDQVLIATAISEIARNILQYAEQGEITFSVISRGRRQGVAIVAQDHGPGIPDMARALQDGYSTGNSLGLGLPGARRLMDDFELLSEVAKGTTVTMRKWTA